MKKINLFFLIAFISVVSSCSVMLTDFQKMVATVPYTVENYFEAIDTDDYDPALTKKEQVNGKPGTKTEVKAKDVIGFTAEPVEQVTIADDGSTVVKVYYKRNMVTLTFDANGGTWSEPTDEEKPAIFSIDLKYGAAVNEEDFPECSKRRPDDSGDDEITGWNPVFPITAPAADTIYVANWKYSASYKVEHYFENKDSDNPEFIANYTIDPELTENHSGQAGVLTDAVALTVEGFTAKNFDQIEISSNNDTVVKILYVRKTITLRLNPNGGKWKDDDSTTVREITGKFDTDVVIPEVILDDYEYTGWDPIAPVTFPATPAAEYKAQWSQAAAAYTVKYWFEKATSVDSSVIDGNYVQDPNYPDVTSLKGEIDNDTRATVIAGGVEGFVAPDGVGGKVIEQQKIAADGSTVVNVYYIRKTITLTFNPNGGKWNDDSTTTARNITGKYGAAVTVPALAREHFTLNGWTPAKPETFPSTSPADAYKADWTQVSANYTVKYWFEKADSTDSSINSNYVQDITNYPNVVLVGNINADTAATALDSGVEGFVAPGSTGGRTIVQKKVVADGSTVVDVYYTRKMVTITFKVNEGKWKDDSTTTDRTFTGKYGAPVTLPVVERTDWEFTKWEPENPTTYPLTNTTYTAKWSQQAAKYIIKYWFEKVTSTDSSVKPENYEQLGAYVDEQGKGELGELTAAAALSTTPDGFVAPASIDQVTITADGKATVNVYYTRKRITLTFNAGDGAKWSNGDTTKIVTGLWGASVTAPSTSDLTKEDYALESTVWAPTVPSKFAESGEYTAQWRKVGSVYTVKYYFENTSGTGYDQDLATYPNLSNVKGTIGQKTAATALSSTPTGFIAPSASGGVAIEQQTITDDGTTVVSVYYKRQRFNLTFNAGTGAQFTDGTTSKTITGIYGGTIAAPENDELEKEDYALATPVWKPELPTTCTAAGTYTAQWVQVNATYTVKYWFEKVDSDDMRTTTNYEAKAGDAYKNVVLKGEIGKKTVAEVLSTTPTGFVAPGSAGGVAITQQTIEASNTVVNVYYARKRITLTFNAGDGAKWSNGDTSKTVTGLYGAPVVAPETSSLTKKGYKLADAIWSPAVPSTYEAAGTYTAQWVENSSSYVIKYYWENANDTGYTEFNPAGLPASGNGIVGETTTVTIASGDYPPNCLAPTVNNVTITNGENVVTVKFPRKTYTFTFNLDGGTWDGANANNKTISGKYGANVTGVPSTTSAVKPGWTFKGWNTTIPSTYDQDRTFTAEWGTSSNAGLIDPITGKDVSLTYRNSGSTYTFTATPPVTEGVTSTWTYEWYVNGALQSGQTGATFTKTLTEDVKYTIAVKAKESTSNATRTKQITVTYTR